MEFVDDGVVALQRLDEKVFDVIVSDMRMPVADGAAVLRRAVERNPGAARLMLSGQTGECSGVVPAGAHRFVDKPCPVALVELELEQALVMTELLAGRGDSGLQRLWSNPLGAREGWRDVLQAAAEPSSLCLSLTQLLDGEEGLFRRVATAIAEVRSDATGDELSPRSLVERVGARDTLFASLAVEVVDTVLPGYSGPWLSEDTVIADSSPGDSSLSCLLSPLITHVPDPEGLALLSWLLPGWGFAADTLEAVLSCTMGSLRFGAHFAAPEGR